MNPLISSTIGIAAGSFIQAVQSCNRQQTIPISQNHEQIVLANIKGTYIGAGIDSECVNHIISYKMRIPFYISAGRSLLFECVHASKDWIFIARCEPYSMIAITAFNKKLTMQQGSRIAWNIYAEFDYASFYEHRKILFNTAGSIQDNNLNTIKITKSQDSIGLPIFTFSALDYFYSSSGSTLFHIQFCPYSNPMSALRLDIPMMIYALINNLIDHDSIRNKRLKVACKTLYYFTATMVVTHSLNMFILNIRAYRNFAALIKNNQSITEWKLNKEQVVTGDIKLELLPFDIENYKTLLCLIPFKMPFPHRDYADKILLFGQFTAPRLSITIMRKIRG